MLGEKEKTRAFDGEKELAGVFLGGERKDCDACLGLNEKTGALNRVKRLWFMIR